VRPLGEGAGAKVSPAEVTTIAARQMPLRVLSLRNFRDALCDFMDLSPLFGVTVGPRRVNALCSQERSRADLSYDAAYSSLQRLVTL
jgi:hypothetical protein